MLTFLLFTALALAATVVGGLFFVHLAVGAVFWLLLLPLRLIFKLVFGLGGLVLGMVMAPLIAVLVGVALLVALVLGALALLAPLIPLALLAGFAWALYRLFASRKSPVGSRPL